MTDVRVIEYDRDRVSDLAFLIMDYLNGKDFRLFDLRMTFDFIMFNFTNELYEEYIEVVDEVS